MSDLAEASLVPTSLRQRLLRVLIVLVVIGLLFGLALWLKSVLGGPVAAKRQTAKIALLPDSPPPPPPPKEEKKPEPPKVEPKQAMREPDNKPNLPKPANEPIKMDGPAGNAPSAFAAGTVTNEYQGGAPVVGAAGSSGNASDRAQERFYANTVRQLLHDEIEKHLRPDAGNLTATFALWVELDGSIRRVEIVPTGDAARDTDLRAALDQTSHLLRLPSHKGVTQPMRFRLSLRPAT